MALEFQQVWARSVPSFVGQEVTIHGRVVVSTASFITADYAGYCRGEVLRIDDGGAIAQRLLATLPPSGGGHGIYDEEISITGTVARTSDGFALQNPRACTVTRGDVVVDLPLPGDGRDPI